jgi:hypothetical protein
MRRLIAGVATTLLVSDSVDFVAAQNIWGNLVHQRRLHHRHRASIFTHSLPGVRDVVAPKGQAPASTVTTTLQHH